jgi:uncharacterized membrane protein
MKNVKFITLWALSLGLLSVSCSSDDSQTDTQKPSITLITPQDEQEFEAGEQIHVQANFTDNMALASYKIDIHYTGDSHQHRTLSADEHQQWAYETTGSLSGTSDMIHIDILIPSNAEEGHYHFGVYAIDVSGNQQVIWSEIEVHNHLD